MNDEDSASFLVVGTENGVVFVLHPNNNFKVIHQLTLKAAVAFISSYGVYNQEGYIALSTREGDLSVLVKYALVQTFHELLQPAIDFRHDIGSVANGAGCNRRWNLCCVYQLNY
jgi:hypothetical protein